MRFPLPGYRRRSLQFERLEDRLALSVNIGTLNTAADLPDLNAQWKPTGYAHPVGLIPAQVRTAYSFNNINFGIVAGDGAGQTIAIIDARSDPNIVNDLAVFDQTFGLPDPPSFTVVNQDGGSKLPKKSRGWAPEIALDVEWAHAIAPAANILLVEAKSSSSLGTAIDYARNVPGVTVISVSAGGKEFKSEADADELFTTPAGHEGITFVFASGDDGGKAEYPSSSPYVLSVGGTSLDVSFSGHWQDETVWSDGGGGLSKYEGVPSYQNGLGLTARGTPDVTYDGDPETGFAVYDSYGVGGWAQFGGTSAGTPQWAALIAIANQGRVLAGQDPLANAQAALYAMPHADFHDITSGDNGISSAAPGYDLASGLGSPIANLLIPDLVAYSGSTDFTVAAPVSTKLPKTKKHDVPSSITFDRQAVAIQNNVSVSMVDYLPIPLPLREGPGEGSLQASRSIINLTSNIASSPTTPADHNGAASTSDYASTTRRHTRRRHDESDTRVSSRARAFAGIDMYFSILAH